MLNKQSLSKVIQSKIKRDFACGSKPYTIIQRYLELVEHSKLVYRFYKSLEYSQEEYIGVDLCLIGLPQKLTKDNLNFIKEFIASQCDYYLDKLRDKLGYARDVWVSKSTLLRAIKGRVLTCKVITQIAAQRD